MSKFDKMCLPAKIYLILSMISIASMFFSTYNVMDLFESLLVTGVWTYLLNMLCKRGSSTISWFILLLPLFGVVFIGMGKFSSRGFKHMHHLKRYNRLY